MSAIRAIVEKVVSKLAQMALTIMFCRNRSKSLEYSNFIRRLAYLRDHNFQCSESREHGVVDQPDSGVAPPSELLNDAIPSRIKCVVDIDGVIATRTVPFKRLRLNVAIVGWASVRHGTFGGKIAP